jgi:hypothetical protein
VRRSFLRYFHSDEVRERESDLEAARDCIRRVCNASFWDWAIGFSAPVLEMAFTAPGLGKGRFACVLLGRASSL